MPTETKAIDSISFTTSNSIEPFFFADKNSGIQYDLLLSALSLKQIDLQHIIFAPNLRALRLVKNKKVDCIINAPANSKGLHLTQSLISYQNSVFHLASRQLQIGTIEDLKGYSLLGFQNAKKFLGSEFENMVSQHPNYDELSNQKSQVVMLFNGHVDAIVMEEKIFKYYREQLVNLIDTKQVVEQNNLFAPAPRYIACHDKQVAQLVDEAITLLKPLERYQHIQQANYATANDKEIE
ncbi:substrate-binding periplasmic protein [Shewanella maritima]|uniref:substrate-binding periplasmic protein n=1 Tax=Shewanella maritima TaxID=2520507 RepID=UPI0037351020